MAYMNKKEHRISKKYAKRKFSLVGLLLILYVLFTLLIPYFLLMYLKEVNSSVLKDPILYYGIYFIILLFGTLLPFFMMRKAARIPIKKISRNFSATFNDLFVQTIVAFTVCIALTYVSNILFSYIGLEGKLISSIGLSYDSVNLTHPLYVFMLIGVTPLLEEYAFRGVLLQTLARYGKSFGLYASAFIFALAHMNFAEMIPAFAMGILFGKTALRYKSIRPTIISHMLFNALIFILYVVPSYIAQYMAYVLVAIILFAAYLILSGRYERIRIQKLRSHQLTSMVFYSRPTVVIAILLMILDSLLFVFFK